MLFCEICFDNNHNQCLHTYEFIQPNTIFQSLTLEENILFLLENQNRELDPNYSHTNNKVKHQYEDLTIIFENCNKKIEKFIDIVNQK